MRHLSLHKAGQSGYELALSVFFSFFLHAAVIVLALIFATSVAPRIYVPPFYEVKLVGQPVQIAPAPAPAPPAPKTEPAPAERKPQPKAKISAPKPLPKTVNKGDMPELSQKKTKPARDEDARPARTEHVKPAAEQAKPLPRETVSTAAAPSYDAAKAAGKTTGVSVSPVSGEFKQLASYSQIVRDCIERNWNPPPGGTGMRAKVSFRVLRTGRLFGDVNIEESSGNAYFDMAAKRAILSSSPFPSMPEEFYKQYAEFSVDVQEKN